jgi:cytochrome P450
VLAWSLFQLTQNPEYHQKIRKEVVDTIGESALPTPDQIAKLKVTNNFLQETLRVRDPTPFIGARCVEDFEFNGMKFPMHTSFFFTKRRIMSSGLPDAEKFRPDRWDDPEMTGNCSSAECLTPSPLLVPHVSPAHV